MLLLASLRNQPRWAIVTASVLLLLLITYVDYITGWQVSISVFYILPIVLMAGFVGRSAGLLIAGLSAIASSWVEFSWQIPYQSLLTPVWNNSARFIFFALIAILISKLKYQLETLEVTVAERTSSLSKEVVVRKQAERELRNTNEALLLHQQQLQLLAMELARTEEKERRNIAAMLHDHLGQNLTYIRTQVSDLANQEHSPNVRSAIDKIGRILDESIEDVRSLTFEISPPVLDLGLEAALEWQSDQLLEKYGLSIELDFEETKISIRKDIRTTLFQVVRELLINVAKHAATEQARVCLRKTDGTLRIEVRDAGAGFDQSKIGKFDSGRSGFGLFNIRQRIGHLGGKMTIESGPDQGTVVTISVPVAIEAEETHIEGNA